MARRSANAERVRYRILAAREAGLDGRHRRALDELLTIEPAPRWLGLWSLAAARSERVLEGAQAAYERLADIDPERFPNLAGDLVRTRSELLFALQRPAEALVELTRLGADFSEGHESTAEFTWSLLREHRSQLSTEGVTGAPLGWIELALLADQLAGDPTEAGAALNGWRRNFPGHPAGSLLESAVRPEICSGLKPPDRLAMLLPGSQPYRTALKSLRDGFLAARYALMSSCGAPEIAFYEVGDSSHAGRQWSRAATEGADFIVGPLLPESVENAAQVAGGLPTLALNRLRDQVPPANFEEFALAPEHEARQAARQALERGLLRALALYPRDAWGQRIYRGFLEEYQAGGGRLIAREQYSLSAVDNRDLEGVEMPALPALTHQHAQLAHGQLSAAALSGPDFNMALFAMGYDSFKLALALHGGSEALKGGIRGLTGTIYRAPDGSLERELAWARIADGQLTAAEN